MPLIIVTLIITTCFIQLTTAPDSYAEEGEFPFVVAIAYHGRDICGGAIISPYTIVTAAHCINYLDAKDLEVFAGVHNYYIFPRGHSHKVNSTLIHPQYEPTTRDNDVALLKLASPLKLNATAGVDKIEITPTNHVNYGGKLARVIYWELEPGSRLLYTDVELWPEDKCTAANIFGDIAVTVDLPPLSFAMICTDITEGSCIGDDAGSLVVNNQLWGITSLNIECDSEDKPLIFTNMAYVSEWINDVHRSK